ncbi:hypothetical protein FNV43_RR06605 [Rhamnella rubrinervis]|uniref:Uncharacterized protein n=1 Tax=Rhamnella rubrinervis TaxID=2594499 RepID=A0A8K0HDV4_9ROSA|nr:hypothetical protein FNV43_RR06605 [Rhamnella rubrinervis]
MHASAVTYADRRKGKSPRGDEPKAPRSTGFGLWVSPTRLIAKWSQSIENGPCHEDCRKIWEIRTGADIKRSSRVNKWGSLGKRRKPRKILLPRTNKWRFEDHQFDMEELPLANAGYSAYARQHIAEVHVTRQDDPT